MPRCDCKVATWRRHDAGRYAGQAWSEIQAGAFTDNRAAEGAAVSLAWGAVALHNRLEQSPAGRGRGFASFVN